MMDDERHTFVEIGRKAAETANTENPPPDPLADALEKVETALGSLPQLVADAVREGFDERYQEEPAEEPKEEPKEKEDKNAAE